MENQETQAQHREFTANLFIRRLQKAVDRKIFAQIMLGMILFMAGFYFMTYSVNENNAEQNLSMLKDIYLKLYTQSMDFLEDENTVSACLKKLEDPSSMELAYAFNRFNLKSVIRNEIILSDEDGKLLDSSFADGQLTNYLVDYNSAICYNVKNSQKRDVYVATYFDTGNYSDYMFVKPVFEGEQLKGYISLFILGTDWNYYLSDENYDGVIVDERQNVIYRSKAGFANQSGKFIPPSARVDTYNGKRYWIKSEALPECGVTIYSLVYYPKSDAYVIGMIVILLLGALWYHLARWMSRTMAEYNAEQVGRLVKEIRYIQAGNHLHRIHMNTNDEFDEVAHRINRMLDSVRELNSRNTELIMLNARLEMGQLEAQMNPHFLYNTLEIIRTLVLWDAPRAEELIERLVHILRYSVNSKYRDVRLREDMDYIQDYLYIQNVRFGSRFSCSMNFDERCWDCMIPKLLLQPIIENSIKYGFREKNEIHVEIKGILQEDILIINVKDDGPGIPEEKEKELNSSLKETVNKEKSLGLHNIARRLCLQYGEQSGLAIRSRSGEGFEVMIRIEQSSRKKDESDV